MRRLRWLQLMHIRETKEAEKHSPSIRLNATLWILCILKFKREFHISSSSPFSFSRVHSFSARFSFRFLWFVQFGVDFFFYSLVCFVWSTNNLLFMSSLRFVCLRCVSVAQAENNCRCVDERRFVEWISRWIWFGLGVFSLSQNERKKVQKLKHARSDMNSENRFLIASV